MSVTDKLRSAVMKVQQGSRVQRELYVAIPFEAAFAMCLEAVQAISGCSIKAQSPQAGVIWAITRVNWQTFGDTITLKLTALDDGQTRVDISSNTTLYQFIDYGRNAGHIRAITSHLNREQETLLRHADKPEAAGVTLLRAAQAQTSTAPRELLPLLTMRTFDGRWHSRRHTVDLFHKSL